MSTYRMVNGRHERIVCHVLPFFTRRDAKGREQAVCGAYVTQEQLAPADVVPDCYGCAVWVENIDRIEPKEPARVIADITPSAPWGIARTA